jgi:hypothetical protein
MDCLKETKEHWVVACFRQQRLNRAKRKTNGEFMLRFVTVVNIGVYVYVEKKECRHFQKVRNLNCLTGYVIGKIFEKTLASLVVMIHITIVQQQQQQHQQRIRP